MWRMRWHHYFQGALCGTHEARTWKSKCIWNYVASWKSVWNCTGVAANSVLFKHIFLFLSILLQILKKHPCRQCDKSFSSSHSLCRHNRLKHKGLRKVYTCPWVNTRAVSQTGRLHPLKNPFWSGLCVIDYTYNADWLPSNQKLTPCLLRVQFV